MTFRTGAVAVRIFVWNELDGGAMQRWRMYFVLHKVVHVLKTAERQEQTRQTEASSSETRHGT